ncbi:MAGUK p55 subfamily member 7-like [Syngnathoides biaculeatus]|uniref:MAGUK p55 subfamily member 7-like n=1 Tax=Syngnathoides biaculeatus TaxID=300417 RepID=UPI002ADE62B9|nr:MAGUK p55 subfamily member 7-like [Syngnathoides biaculeatus]
MSYDRTLVILNWTVAELSHTNNRGQQYLKIPFLTVRNRNISGRIEAVMSATLSQSEQEEDYRFLHSTLMEKKLHLLFKIHERLRRFAKRGAAPVQQHASGLASHLFEDLSHHNWNRDVRELFALFSKAHFKSLLSVHDAVAQRDYGPSLPPVPDGVIDDDEDSVKIVSLVKTKEPLGATIKRDQSTGAIVVARVMRGGAAHRSGLIHEGDQLKEVNGVSLDRRKPKEILPLLAHSRDDVTFTIVPAFSKQEVSWNKKAFVRALFDYDPREDPAVPCKDAAVSFKRGDILQIVATEDDTWWQARRVGCGDTRAGLVPSQQLHERRVALQRPQTLFRHRQVKAAEVYVDDSPPTLVFPAEEDVDYGAVTGIRVAGSRRSFRLGKKSNWAKEAARSRRWSSGVGDSVCPPTYVEVIPYRKAPQDRHHLVVLLGPSGVGVNELKRRLLISDPDLYGVAVPYTTREKRSQEREGMDYHFVPVHKFEEDILNRRFVDYGTHRGHYYGTSLDSVYRVLAEGKVCLLDLHPCKLKRVYTLEFKPFVVFVKPPRIEELRLTRRRAKFICEEEDSNQVRMFSEADFEDMIESAETMETQHGHTFDEVIVNGDLATAFGELKAALRRLEEEDVRWIPTEWLCSSPTEARRSCGLVAGWI